MASPVVRTAAPGVPLSRSDPRTGAVLLAGTGLVHGAVAVRLTELGLAVRALDAELDVAACVVVSASDGWAPDEHTAAQRIATDRRIPWLRVVVEPGRAVVGPFRVPGEPGCATCAATRMQLAREQADEYSEILRRHGHRLAAPSVSWLTAASVSTLAEVVTAEVVASVRGDRPPRTLCALYFLRLGDLRGDVSRFLPDPRCADCGTLPADSRDAAVVGVTPRLKCGPSSYRAQRLADRADDLRRTFVDVDTGLVRGVARDGHSLFPNATSRVGLRDHHGTEIGFGRTLDYEASELTAIAESVERYGGIGPGGRRTTVRGSRRSLGADAIDPRTLGLHAEWQYDLPNFRFQRYHDDLVLDWVWGYSFGRTAPVLVPETYAYYGHAHGARRDRPFVYEISNGCAVGSCLEEAVLYGLLEIAERDAFLLTWYARIPRPRVDPDSATDRAVPLMVDRIEDTSGYRVHAFDITTEHGIPAFWVMAVDERASDRRPAAHIAAGSHLEPERALANALLELAPLVSRPVEAYRAGRPRALAMLADPHLVRAMDDHAVLYSTAEAFERLAFLHGTREIRTLSETSAAPELAQWQPDLTVDLRRVLCRYQETGLDVIVVDQTTPEHTAGGFRCVKVIVPGTIPMTFGHRFQRVTGLARLASVPALNPHPHPFP